MSINITLMCFRTHTAKPDHLNTGGDSPADVLSHKIIILCIFFFCTTQPPHMCPYQDGNYTITFKDEDRQTLMKVGPFLHRYGNGELFSRTVDPEELEISFVTLMVDSFKWTLPEAMIAFKCCESNACT